MVGGVKTLYVVLLALVLGAGCESGKEKLAAPPPRATKAVQDKKRLIVQPIKMGPKPQFCGIENGGGGGSRTHVPNSLTRDLYMLSRECFFGDRKPSRRVSSHLVRMEFISARFARSPLRA